MKLPQIILISGHKWKIIEKKGVGGGYFDGKKKIICIDIDKDPQDKIEILLHEILEAILCERYHRYSVFDMDRTSKDSDLLYKFMFDHMEFSNIIKDLKLALQDYLH